MVIDRKVFEQKPSRKPRYYKLELIEDNLFSYPIEVKAICEDRVLVKFENGEEKELCIDEWYIKIFNIEKGSGNLPEVEVRNHCVNVDGKYWCAEECYLNFR